MSLLFDIFVGRFAGIVSGLCGLISSISLSKAPVETLMLRRALVYFDNAKGTMDLERQAKFERSLKRRELVHLKAEGRWTLVGLSFLAASFSVLIASEIWKEFFLAAN